MKSIFYSQALFFQLPFVFWASMSQGSGLNLPSLMKGAFTLTEVQKEPSKREVTTVFMLGKWVSIESISMSLPLVPLPLPILACIL